MLRQNSSSIYMSIQLSTRTDYKKAKMPRCDGAEIQLTINHYMLSLFTLAFSSTLHSLRRQRHIYTLPRAGA